MCILCAIQKWSRRVATMLPWLVIPLIGLWALSQLLPPAFRFEITSPRLACVFVLLVTLFWYEVLMPQLSAWRVRRNARIKEKQRLQAIELDKLRRTATRRCRNCLTPYRDQNPGGSRFMCAYCGHISKRPVLDLPVPPGMRITNHVTFRDTVSNPGKSLSSKMWPRSGWMCRHDWLDEEKSYSGVVVFSHKLFFSSTRWLWRKVFRISAPVDDTVSHAERSSSKRPESASSFHESKGEKSRRKAEEKRQARVEKELLEQEERKQREEVARLIEERRKQRDAKISENSRDRVRASVYARDRNMKREAEKKRRRDRDKGSSKSSSDGEDLERRMAVRDSERKRDDTGGEIVKGHAAESGHVLVKGNSSSPSKGNSGTRYLDRMRGTFFSPTKAFGRGGLFGKVGNSTVSNENKSISSTNPTYTPLNRRDSCPPDCAVDAQGSSHNLVPKKSWQQLFARSPPPGEGPCEVRSPLPPGPARFFFSSAEDPVFPCEEDDIFKDPCYDPDPAISELEIPHPLKNASPGSAPNAAARPSPIESPVSRMRDETKPEESWNPSDTRTWQMWNTSPLGQDGLSFVCTTWAQTPDTVITAAPASPPFPGNRVDAPEFSFLSNHSRSTRSSSVDRHHSTA